MTASPFDPTFEDLPESLPVFPLPGVLLLPRGRLPLNIFEPRHLAMTDDALRSGNRLIGMIQPASNGTASGPAPPLYKTGCAGRITQFAETDDGRYLMTLMGVARFTVVEELPTTRGYRRVVADWTPFRFDLVEEEACGVDRAELIGALKPYFKHQGLSANWEAVEQTPDEKLITTLSMICPFDPPEKQALLEARDLAERARILMALLQMAAMGTTNQEDSGPRH